MRQARLSLIPLAIAIVAIAAGCGGGGGSSRLSHADFVKQATVICADYNQRIKALGSPKSLQEIPAFADKAIPIAQEDVDKFAKLKPPKEDEAGAAAYVAAGRTLIDLVRQLKDAAAKNDQAAIQAISTQGNANSAASRKVAQALGLAECAKKN